MNAKSDSSVALRHTDADELDRVQQFHEFLQGRLPDGVSVTNPPRMTAEDAFEVIWFLQEVAGLITDSIEMCAYCGTLFDSNREGHLGDTADENYCSSMCEASDGKSTSEDADGDEGE